MRSSRNKIIHPNIRLWLRTWITKSRFTGKWDMFYISTTIAFIRSKSHSASTTKHLFYIFDGVWSYLTFILYFENISIVFEYGFDRYMSGDNLHDYMWLETHNLRIVTFFWNQKRKRKIVRNSRTILQNRNFKKLILNIFCPWYGNIDVKIKIIPWISIVSSIL